MLDAPKAHAFSTLCPKQTGLPPCSVEFSERNLGPLPALAAGEGDGDGLVYLQDARLFEPAAGRRRRCGRCRTSASTIGQNGGARSIISSTSRTSAACTSA